MKITPLAAESLGTRSVATYLETQGVSLLLNPGAELAPQRYALGPHSLEEFQLDKHIERIQLYAESADILVITRFTRGHFIPDALDTYRDKILFLKNPNKGAFPEERKAAFDFIQNIKGIPRELIYIDERTFDIRGCRFSFSKAVPGRFQDTSYHALMVAVSLQEDCFVYVPDSQGVDMNEINRFIVHHNPGILYLDGPATYLVDASGERAAIEPYLETLEGLLELTKLHTLILDHHLLRDIQWPQRFESFQQAAAGRIRIQSASELRGEPVHALEARRKELYASEQNAL